jgi:thiosulfate/3-mercaptopyruvate sulfurtransferase
MPNDKRDAKEEHKKVRIPTAVFFDLDEISDHSTNLPHMMPSNEDFINHMKRLRVKRIDDIICYDNLGIFSSARVAWMMRYFGVDSVRVLNGGFKKW